MNYNFVFWKLSPGTLPTPLSNEHKSKSNLRNQKLCHISWDMNNVHQLHDFSPDTAFTQLFLIIKKWYELSFCLNGRTFRYFFTELREEWKRFFNSVKGIWFIWTFTFMDDKNVFDHKFTPKKQIITFHCIDTCYTSDTSLHRQTLHRHLK